MSRQYNCRPSDYLGLDDEDAYTKYCFDEACAYILSRLEEKEKPRFRTKEKAVKGKSDNKIIGQRHYKSASDLYKSMGFSKGEYKKTIDS